MVHAPDLTTIRHSGAHLMAAAIHRLWPGAAFGVGPATDLGFFYDVELDVPLLPADLVRIEAEIDRLRAEAPAFERIEMPVGEAIALMRDLAQPYKVELLEALKAHGATSLAKETGDADLAAMAGVSHVSLYRTGDFIDLCRGPHVASAAEIGVIKLRSVAGAYWRGDASRPQLQRIHALCFATLADLEAAERQLALAAERDHRKLGKQLKLFALTQEAGAGLPLWLPNGMVLRDELEHLARREERREGYRRVATPHIAREALYARSGHLDHYREDMYAPLDIEGESYFLRPMNCPHHHLVYGNDRWSYRQLPVRLSEYGQVYRYEASGGLSGLMRTRGFCQNDAHIYCREDQVVDEFLAVMRLHARYYALFGITDFRMRLSLPDPGLIGKYVDDPQGWMKALGLLRQAMAASGLPHEEAPGEAAFYGPKVDFMIRSAVGTEYAISTNQLDFVAARRFDLSYVAEDGTDHPAYVIHRAPLGSHERFVAFLIEHYGGDFPVWLAPVQARVIPVADRHLDYAEGLRGRLFDADVPTASGGVRVDVDSRPERMQRKIRDAELEKVPYMLVVGDRDVAANQVSVRARSGAALGSMPVQALIDRLRDEVTARRDLG